MNGGVEEENETRPHHHHHDHEGGATTTAVIENIDSINNNNNNSTNNNEQDDEGIISTAISDDETSATSIASTLSDGISRRRPRSVSLHNNITPRISDSDNDNSDANHHRPSSIPRLRPRSNPRTRTPMRHESPLLVISPVFGGGHHAATEAGRMRANEHHVDGIAIRDSNSEGSAVQLDNVDESSSNTDNERLIRNIFHTRRNHRARRLRAGSISIPEEDSMVADVAVVDEGGTTNVENITLATAASNNSNTASNQANNSNGGTAPPPAAEATTTNNNTTTRRTAGRFFTQAVATNSTASSSTRRRRNNNQSNQPNTTQQRTLSTKQNPSHRKIRRWKNDAFIGTPSEHVHTMLVTREGTSDDSKGGRGWNEFPYMPNYPREYKSEFGRLSMDRTRGGEVARQRFVRGEVASVDFALKKNGSDDVMGEDEEEEEWEEEMVMQRRIVAKCRQLGMSPKIMNEYNNDEWGKVLYDKLGSRIQSILSRSCSSSGNNDEATVTNASRIVSTFETYLVSLALQSKKIDIGDNGSSVMGFPLLQSQYVYDVFDEILASPPRIVIREKRSSSNSCKQRIDKAASIAAAAAAAATTKAALDMNKCGVLIPTIHFYFPTEDQDGSSRRSSAFHRILLYAVCQFHGLETSSSVVLEKNLKQDNVRKRGKQQQQQQQQQHVKGSVKVVTIQGGLLLAPSIKLLDFVCT